jgi:hypothetical protein
MTMDLQCIIAKTMQLDRLASSDRCSSEHMECRVDAFDGHSASAPNK